jgi:hypothetical protein
MQSIDVQFKKMNKLNQKKFLNFLCTQLEVSTQNKEKKW